ncbi:MAG: LacI family DNA-binding transcriptional regulator [Flavobacteriaceae bacterium]|nr:LacI family DNA-binding transcriptional regulator [Flavobacteriaceae bacterium]
MYNKISLKDIAKELNLSKTAVSLVLNNKGDANNISRPTQERIYAYAKKKNYKPNEIARWLSLGKTKTIGLIIPRISDSFYANIASYIERRAMEMGYTVFFSSSNEDPKKEATLIQSMFSRQVEGLIIASTQKNHAEIKYLKDNNLPFVLIDRHYPDIDTNFVVVNNYSGANRITKHLLKLARKRVGFITIKSDLKAMKERLRGYVEAIELHTENHNELVKSLDYEKFESQMDESLSDLIFLKKIDALVFSTHFLVRAGIRSLKRLGIEIPAKVAIASFSELSEFDLVNPPITVMRQPVKDIGNTAVDILFSELNELKDVKTMERTKKQRVLEPEFLIRKSCGS